MEMSKEAMKEFMDGMIVEVLMEVQEIVDGTDNWNVMVSKLTEKSTHGLAECCLIAGIIGGHTGMVDEEECPLSIHGWMSVMNTSGARLYRMGAEVGETWRRMNDEDWADEG